MATVTLDADLAALAEARSKALRARLPAAAHEALDGYIRSAQFPAAVVQSILAEGPDTGVNGAAGKTWEHIAQALIDMRAAGKPFTPLVLRAFIRKLLEAPPAKPGESPGDRARATASRLEKAAKK